MTASYVEDCTLQSIIEFRWRGAGQLIMAPVLLLGSFGSLTSYMNGLGLCFIISSILRIFYE